MYPGVVYVIGVLLICFSGKKDKTLIMDTG